MQENAANIPIPVARQGADPRFDAIHVLNTRSKSKIVDGFQYEADGLVNLRLIRIGADDVARVLSKQDVACNRYTHGFLCVRAHLLGVEIYRAVLWLHDLVS